MLSFGIVVLILLVTGYLIMNSIKKKQDAEVEGNVESDEKAYTIDKMMSFVKKRLDEITKVNLYDIGLSEAELERRKNKKYELKKALKGCTYGDVNDKKYVKTLIYDLLLQEYPQVPSQKIIDTIIEYSQSKEYFSPTLEKTILISVN